MIKVYVAASSKEKVRASLVMDRIRASPILEVAHDWIAVQASVQANGGPSDAELSRAGAAGYALADLLHVEGAHVFWMLAPNEPTCDAWIEFGYAIASEREKYFRAMRVDRLIVASGPVKQSIFCALAEEHATDQGAFESITAWGHRWEKSHGSKREAQAEPISE